MWTSLWVGVHVSLHMCAPFIIVCVRVVHNEARGKGLILCGLERINFVLTLAGCGLHPYPPLLSIPGASQRRRQASRDGENEGALERRGEIDSKKCHFKKGLYSLFLTVSPFYELASVQELFKCVYFLSLWVCLSESVFLPLICVDTVSRGNLFTNVICLSWLNPSLRLRFCL